MTPEIRVLGREPDRVHRPTDREGLAEAVRDARHVVVPVGGATRLHLGGPLRAEAFDAIDLRGLNRIVEHAVADMTVTVEAGVTLAALAARLSEHGQWLPLDPPFPGAATVGGLLATAAWGPLRPLGETARRHLIGITVMGPDGTRHRAGGRVVKNVAGYDLMKLYTGSLGTLGIIMEATFRTHPKPELEVLHLGATGGLEALMDLAAQLNRSDLDPAVFLAFDARTAEALRGAPSRLPLGVAVGFTGFVEDVAWREETFYSLAESCGMWLDQRLEGAAAAEFRDRLRLNPAPGETKLRAAILPTETARLLETTFVLPAELTGSDRPGLFLMYPSLGQLRALFPTGVGLTPAHLMDVRRAVEAIGGRLMVETAPAVETGGFDPWGTVGDGLDLCRGLKAALDPTGRFNPGRFAGGI